MIDANAFLESDSMRAAKWSVAREVARLDSKQAAVALGLKGFIPPNVVALAAAAATDAPSARALAAAGYDGVLLGRRLLADPSGAKRLVEQIRDIAVAPADMLAYGG